jgi:hypothetical protein
MHGRRFNADNLCPVVEAHAMLLIALVMPPAQWLQIMSGMFSLIITISIWLSALPDTDDGACNSGKVKR